MRTGEHITIEAARMEQLKREQTGAPKVVKRSRNDVMIMIGVLILAILSVVALVLKGQ